MLPLRTLPQIAREFGLTDRQADYAVRSRRIEPIQRVGITRLFSNEQAQHIAKLVREIGAQREESPRG